MFFCWVHVLAISPTYDRLLFCVDDVYWPYILLIIDYSARIYNLNERGTGALKTYPNLIFAIIS